MLGSGETEAAGLRVSSLFPQMAIIHYLDFSCYFLHPPLFFPFCLCFYFKQLGWRQRMRVRGGWAPTRGGSRSPSSKGWAPSRRLTSPCAPGAWRPTARCSPAGPTCPGTEGRAWDGRGSGGISSRAQGVLGAAVWVGAVCLTPMDSPGTSLNPRAPLSGEGAQPSSSGPLLCTTTRILASPCASLAPPPIFIRMLFLSSTCTKMLRGRAAIGEVSPNPLTLNCARRSSHWLSGDSRQERPRDHGGA